MNILKRITLILLSPLLATHIAQATTISWSTTSGEVLLRVWEAPIFVDGVFWAPQDQIDVEHRVDNAQITYDTGSDELSLRITTEGVDTYRYGSAPKGTPFPEGFSTLLEPVEISMSLRYLTSSNQLVDLNTKDFDLGYGPPFDGSITVKDQTQVNILYKLSAYTFDGSSDYSAGINGDFLMWATTVADIPYLRTQVQNGSVDGVYYSELPSEDNYKNMLFEVQIMLDDIKPENTQPVPEPSTLLLLSPALVFIKRLLGRV